MLFEELMMQSRFAVIRDVAITNQPIGESISAADYIVTWGQRGRIGDDKLTDRVLFSASRVLPEFDSQAAINLVPTPIEMVEGSNWFDNLTISPIGANVRKMMGQRNSVSIFTEFAQPSSANITPEQENNFNRYYQKPLPLH
jgi:hypothetical protein